MPPALVPVLGRKSVDNRLKLAHAHLRQLAEVHNRPTARRTAADDVAARRLLVALAVQAAAEIDIAAVSVSVSVAVAVAERRQDPARRRRPRAGQARHHVQLELGQELLLL